jgi:predicted methyltransferase
MPLEKIIKPLPESTVLSSKFDDNTLVKTTTEIIDLTPYKEQLIELLEMKEPDDKECLELGKRTHPYYTWRNDKILELQEILGE